MGNKSRKKLDSLIKKHVDQKIFFHSDVEKIRERYGQDIVDIIGEERQEKLKENYVDLSDKEDVLIGEKLLKFDVENKNDRIYKKEEFTKLRFVKVPFSSVHGGEDRWESLLERMNNTVMLGELDYPDSFSIDLQKASHCLYNIRIEGDYLV